MAVRRLAAEQPDDFTFTRENLAWAKNKVKDYPEGRQASAVIPILWKAQEQNAGWLPEPAIRLVADMLEMPYIRVFEIATFYTMFQLQPVGTVAHVNVCGTTPCMLRGAPEIVDICKKRIAPQPFQRSADGKFTWEEVECAGACVNAPMVQIGADTYEDLTPETFNALLDALEAGEPTSPGPQSARKASEPITGVSSLDPDAKRNIEAKLKRLKPEPAAKPAKPANAAKPASTAKQTAAAKPAAAQEPAAAPASASQKVAEKKPRKSPSVKAAEVDLAAVARADGEGTRPPEAEAAARAAADNLQELTGIGPVMHGRLHALGIFTFAQIAQWDDTHTKWVSAYVGPKGLIDAASWVEQAKAIVNQKP
ncbi:MAG: NADH-quinone oxidoreductase subunit NuoE [Pseudomonadota bacterium]